MVKNSKLMRVAGFTLAEVLITLAIIGVIAAITIVTLNNNLGDKEAVSQLKKVYSTLTSAFNLAVKDNGSPESWGFIQDNGDLTKLRPILSTLVPYLKVAKDCTQGTKGCFSPGKTYACLGGESVCGPFDYDDDRYPTLKLADGTEIYGTVSTITGDCDVPRGTSQALSNTCGYYMVDINGEKSPNTYGKDLFSFYVTKYGIVPAGMKDETVGFSTNCKKTKSGNGCAAWVIYNENRDYLKDNCTDLDWGGKTKCD
jgi:prepilin-type N-terminal cleavage/methylation domain-containing protein